MDGVYLFSKMHFTESVYMAGAVMPVLYALVATMITFLLTSFGAYEKISDRMYNVFFWDLREA